MVRYGKPYWDYDPCEECSAEECEKCEYYFSEKGEDECTNAFIVDNEA